MSDIAIRFDGLALLATLALSTLAYLLVALAALIARRRRTARLAALMTAATLALTTAFAAYWLQQGTAYTGANLTDPLVLPWAALFLAGCWLLTRTTPGERRQPGSMMPARVGGEQHDDHKQPPAEKDPGHG